MGHHLKQAATRRMILPVGLEVLSQMLDPSGEKCDLHIRTAGVVFMQLELLQFHRLGVLCHNEGANVDEEFIFATVCQNRPRAISRSFLYGVCFAFAVVPQTQLSPRPGHARSAKDHDKERAENFFS